MPNILTPIRARSSAASRVAVAVASIFAAATAWLAQGTIAFAGTGATRVALLPVSHRALLAVGIAAAGVIVAWRRGASLAPLTLLALLVLPWMPLALPPMALMWSGPLSLLVWAAVALSLAASIGIPAVRVARPAMAAGALAAAVFAVAAWQVAPSIPGGDEPH